MAACPHCGADNREGAKFCADCGTPVGLACPACGAPGSPGQKFCDECGTPFGGRSAASSQPREAPSAERRIVSVLFADLVGFTPLSQRTSPAKLLELISQFEAQAFEVASGHGGRIVKHIGDEVMFVALDAGAGCAIARDITTAYSEGIEPRGGVAFGDVITRHGDYYGTVVNLASRLAELAVPGEVLVNAATASSAGDPFEFRPAGRRLLKGFEQPVEVFSLDVAPRVAPAGSLPPD